MPLHVAIVTSFLLVILATTTMFIVVLAVLILATVRVLAKRRVCCVNNTMRAIFTRRAFPEYAHLLKINHCSKNYYMPPCYSNKHAPRRRWLHILKIRILSGTAARACRGSCAFGYTRRANIRRTCAPLPDAFLCLFWPLLLFSLPYQNNCNCVPFVGRFNIKSQIKLCAYCGAIMLRSSLQTPAVLLGRVSCMRLRFRFGVIVSPCVGSQFKNQYAVGLRK